MARITMGGPSVSSLTLTISRGGQGGMSCGGRTRSTALATRPACWTVGSGQHEQHRRPVRAPGSGSRVRLPAYGRQDLRPVRTHDSASPNGAAKRTHHRKRQLNWALAASAVVIVVVMFGASQDGRLSWAGVGALLTAAVVCAGMLLWLLKRWGEAQLAELAHGYTTSPIHLGQFWIGRRSGALFTSGWVQWDWSGLWVLDRVGAVVSSPRPGVDGPPGFYPNARSGDRWELWTGCMWTGVTREP